MVPPKSPKNSNSQLVKITKIEQKNDFAKKYNIIIDNKSII